MNRNGRLTWRNDDAEGGVTAAAIEQEAEGIPFSEHLGKLSIASHQAEQAEKDAAYWRERAEKAEQAACPDPDAHWRLDEALERAERAERERDEATARAEQPRPLTPADITLHSANSASWVRVRVEHPALGVIEEGIPLPTASAPNVVTDEMVKRAKLKAGELGWFRRFDAPEWKQVLTVALTEPQRPDGAEELQDVLACALPGPVCDVITDKHLVTIADYLAARGVRVTGAES